VALIWRHIGQARGYDHAAVRISRCLGVVGVSILPALEQHQARVAIRKRALLFVVDDRQLVLRQPLLSPLLGFQSLPQGADLGQPRFPPRQLLAH
jgi:hypothetical protein